MQKFVGGYKLQFLNYKPVLTLTIIFFIGMNLLAVIFGAKPHDEGKIPRFWWPVLFFIILAGSCLYWLVFWGLQQTLDHKTGTTVGQKIGLDVKVYEEDDENDEMSAEMSAEMKADMVKAMMDGTRRRTQYKVSNGLRRLKRALADQHSTLARSW
jgi:preprotein translocase subunit SecF